MSRVDKTTKWGGTLELDMFYVLQKNQTGLEQKDGHVDSPFVLTIEPIGKMNSYSVKITIPPFYHKDIPPVTTIAQAFTSSGKQYLLVKSLNAELEITAREVSTEQQVLKVNFTGSGGYPDMKLTGIVYGKGHYVN